MRGLLFDIAALQVPERNAKLEVQGLYPGAMYGADFASFPASNMTTTAASFARRTSKPNEARRPEWVDSVEKAPDVLARLVI